jgi:hypothetical protein
MKKRICTEGDIVLRASKLEMDNFAPAGIFRDECLRVVICCGDGGVGMGAERHRQ